MRSIEALMDIFCMYNEEGLRHLSKKTAENLKAKGNKSTPEEVLKSILDFKKANTQ